jgi:hypothetical protein
VTLWSPSEAAGTVNVTVDLHAGVTGTFGATVMLSNSNVALPEHAPAPAVIV